MRMTSGFWGKWGSLRGKKHLFAASKRGFFPLKKTVMSPDPSGNRPQGVLPLKQELLPAQAFFLIDANNARRRLCSLPEAGRRFPGLRDMFPRAGFIRA